jgi:two-component system sensor histidine kinase ChvG
MSLRSSLARIRWLRPSRIGPRLLVFHLLLVFLPVAGILYLEVYEAQLLDSQETSMVQQGRLIDAALGDREPLAAEDASALLTRLGRRGDARIRIYDASAAVIADSARMPDLTAAARASSEGASEYDSAPATVRQRPLYRFGAWLARRRRSVRLALLPSRITPSDTLPTTAPSPGPEVQAALHGRYGAATRATPGQRSLTLFSAVPIRHGDHVIGAALVSQSTFRILQALYRVRLRIFEIVVASVAVAVLLGLLMSATIVRPLVRLRRDALAVADRQARPATFGGVNRSDEIGDLARALDDLTTRLASHIQLLESFSADVSHEFKNPLASIRNAAEMIASSDDGTERDRLLAMLRRDVDRLERLVSGVRELARIDGQLAHDAVEPVDVPSLLREIVRGFEERGHHVTLDVPLAPPLLVRATADRLAQVFENLLQNAVSLAPGDTRIEVTAAIEDGWCRTTVSDRGPGIPPAHLDRVFERFFTYRPNEGSRREHTGLGLSIARAIVEGYGGTIAAANREGGGAVFEVRLPLSRRGQALSRSAPAVSHLRSV